MITIIIVDATILTGHGLTTDIEIIQTGIGMDTMTTTTILGACTKED